MTVWTAGVGDGEGDPPAGGEGLGKGLALGEGGMDVVPKTAGDAAAAGLGFVEAIGVGEAEGATVDFIEGLSGAWARALGEGDGATVGVTEGNTERVWPNTSGSLSSTFAGKRTDFKNNPELIKTTNRSPVRIKASFGILIFFMIYRELQKKEVREQKSLLQRPNFKASPLIEGTD